MFSLLRKYNKLLFGDFILCAKKSASEKISYFAPVQLPRGTLEMGGGGGGAA